MSEYLQVVTTIDDEQKAKELCRALVELKLVACAQVTGPILSFYRWKNEVHEDTEWRCILKTNKELYSKLQAKIKQLHPYNTPQILALEIIEGDSEYLKWVDQQTLG